MLDVPELGDHDIAASPEWFGSGWKCFRQILMRRELAELIAGASPRDFTVVDITVSPEPLRPIVFDASLTVPRGAISEPSRSWGTWESCGVWAEPGAHHLMLKNPRPIAEPIPYRGALGLRTLDEATCIAVWEAIT